MHMRVMFAAAMILLLAGPADAQLNSGNKMPGPPPPSPKTRQEIEAERTAEKAYSNSLKSIPDKPPADPWGIARGADTPQATAKIHPAKPAAKAGSTAN